MSSICYVVPRYLPSVGGIEIHIRELATRAAAAGHRVEVATQCEPGAAATVDTIDGITVRRFESRLDFRGQGNLSRGLQAYVAGGADGADVVHVHNFHVPSSLLAIGASRVPVVFTPHYLGARPGLVDRVAHRAYRVLARNVLPQARVIVHVSRAEAAQFSDEVGAFPAVGRVIVPNGVDVDLARTAIAVPHGGRLVVMACRLEEYKQPQLAVRGLLHVPDDVHLVIAGEGPEAEPLHRLVTELGLRDRVTLTGGLPKTEVFGWLRSADVVLSLSRKECFGLTLLEGLAADADLVATRLPAHLEVAADAGYPTGNFVAEHPSPEEIGLAITAALGRHVPGPFRLPTWDSVAARVLRIYDDVLGRPVAVPTS